MSDVSVSSCYWCLYVHLILNSCHALNDVPCTRCLNVLNVVLDVVLCSECPAELCTVYWMLYCALNVVLNAVLCSECPAVCVVCCRGSLSPVSIQQSLTSVGVLLQSYVVQSYHWLLQYVVYI